MIAKDYTILAATAALITALLFACWTRFTGLDWDNYWSFHPDERNLVAAAANWTSWGADPGFYAYNGLGILLPRLVSAAMAQFGIVTDPNSIASLTFAARGISAASSLMTVAVLSSLAAIVAGRVGAAFVAWLTAADVGLIQAAHFGTTESTLVLTLTITALSCTAFVANRIGFQSFVTVTSVALGLGAGLKTTALAGALMPAIALLFCPQGFTLRRTIIAAIAGALIAGAIFAAVSPHSILNWQRFLEVMQFEARVVSGNIDVFWTWQFTDTPVFVYQLAQLIWLSGPFVPGLGLAGLIIILWANIATHDSRWRSIMPLAIFTLVYLFYVSTWHAKFIRYLLPAIPGLIIGALVIFQGISERKPRLKITVLSVAAIMVCTSILWACAFSAVYWQEDARLQASRYIQKHARDGEIVLIEPRDIRLPVRLDAKPEIQQNILPVMDDIRPDLTEEYARSIAAADWIVIASQRNYAVLSRLGARFPLACPYYTALFSGKFGFDFAGRFTNNPGLFGLSIDTRDAEETFSVFDHPSVLVFRRGKSVSVADIQTELTSKKSCTSTHR